MSEDETQNKPTRQKYLDIIAQELNIELERYGNLSRTTPVLKLIKFGENGEMLCAIPIQPKAAPNYYEPFHESEILIKYLVGKLVDAQIELCNQKQKTEGLKTELTKAKEAINGVLEGLNSV